MYTVIAFDCDGTLVDCSQMIGLLEKGYHKVYPNRTKLSYEDFIPCYYMTSKQMKKYLHVCKEDEQKLHDLSFGKHGEMLKDSAVFEGMIEVWETLHHRKIRIGINTSRTYQTFLEIKRQMRETFDYIERELIITQDDIQNPKPSPESLLLLQKRADCPMSEILYVGDSLQDALCAQAAGCDFALAVWGMVMEQDIPARYRVDHPKDLLKIIG